MKNKKIREMLEKTIPKPGYKGHPQDYDESLQAYYTRIISTLADGAEIVYGEDRVWVDVADPADTLVAIRLKPQPVDQRVTKSEIVKLLKNGLNDFYSTDETRKLASRIERYGIKDGE